MEFILTLIAFALVLFVAPRFLFRIKDLSHLDQAHYPVRDQPPSDGLTSVLSDIRQLQQAAQAARGKARLKTLRHCMDHLNDDLPMQSEFRSSSQPRGEWVLAPGADSRRRVLYIHGGAWAAFASARWDRLGASDKMLLGSGEEVKASDVLGTVFLQTAS